MEHFAGIDVSLKDSSVCVVEAAGRIMREAYTNRPLLRAIVAQWRVAIEVMRAGSARRLFHASQAAVTIALSSPKMRFESLFWRRDC
jgi:hypothetical protein